MRSELDNAERSTLADRIYEQLREGIVAGEFEPGAELNQVDLARKFGVSRIPVREALNRLHAERLLSAEPFHRHVVRSLSAAEVMELIQIRIQLECLGLRRSSDRLQGPTLDRLDSINRGLRTEADPRKWLEGDWELHRVLVGPGTAISEFVDDIRLRIHRYLNFTALLEDRHARAVVEHQMIIDALRRGDLEGAQVRLTNHILATGEELVKLMSPSG